MKRTYEEPSMDVRVLIGDVMTVSNVDGDNGTGGGGWGSDSPLAGPGEL